MAENLDLNINIETKGKEVLGIIKKELKEANGELVKAQLLYGEYSKEAINAANKVAELKDRIGEARETSDLFDPGKKFQAFSGALSTVAAGFGAIQGAMGLFGAESDNVQKTLLKVQSAMALSQGLSAIKDGAKDFERLGAMIQQSTLFQKANNAATAAAAAVQRLFTGAVNETAVGFKVLKGAIAATGIGLILVALGAIVSYWDDITASINGVSSAQKQLNVDAEKNLQSQEKKLTSLDNQTNQLKLQGKSEKEILQIKLKQTKETIAAAKVSLLNAKATRDAQVSAAKRNRDIVIGILNFLTTPIRALMSTIDDIGKALGKNFGLVAAMEKTNLYLANMVFDPAETAKEGDAAIEVAEDKLEKLESTAAGYQLQIRDINKKGNQANNKDAEDQKRKELEGQAILNEANKKLKTQQEQELQTIAETYAEKRKKLAEAGIKDNGDLAKAEQAERTAVEEKYKKQELEKEQAFQAELNKIKLDLKLSGIKDEYEKSKLQIEENYKKQYEDIDKNENYNQERKTALKVALQQKETAELDALKLENDKKNAEQDIADLDKEITKASSDLELQKTLLNQKDILLQEYHNKNLISDKIYTDGVEANSKARIEIDKQETEAKIRNAEILSQLLNTVSDAIGRNTAIGKATAIAATTIDTYLGAQKAYTSQLIPGDPTSPIRAAIAGGIAVAGGIKNVKSILSVKTPAGGGGGASAPSLPTVSASAPMAPQPPQAQTTNISQQSIDQMGNQAVRAYVIENDVTSNQQRVEAIKQRARFS
jgi:myosin heavy subunit